MNSKICELLDIEFPLVAFTHCRDVVVAVSKAGGCGVLGAVGMSPDSPPPPADDPMGAALDSSAAQSDAGGAGGQAPGSDPMADMPDPGMDSDMPKPEEDDQGGGAVG